MDFDLTDTQRQRTDALREAVADRLGGPPPEDRSQRFDRDRWRVVGELGLLGLCLPEEHGGGGLGALDTALALEAFGRSCPDMGLVFAAAAHLLACGVPVAEHGTPEARAELLPGIADGRLVCANAMTEDDAGSDVSAQRCRAVRHGEHWELSGEKSFASNAPVADLLVTYAVTSPDAGFLGTTAFVVPTTAAGVTRSEPMAKMGLQGCLAGRVTFDGAIVADHHVLGAEGQGAAIFQASMGWERACLFAAYLGLMERQIALCVAHARERRQFGRRLSEFQAVSHRITEMIGRVEAARLLLHRACWLKDQGREDAGATALSKLATSEASVQNSLSAIQVFGGRGFLAADGIEEQLRDCVPATIFSGTSAIQHELVAQGAGL
jgi:L-prolyl-[peptidyl-carrier protein] dehydrogenase